MNKKHQKQNASVAKKIMLLGAVVVFGLFLIIPSAITTHGFHKETALLKKYDNLQDLVKDIRNGKVDFKEFRESDGINPTVMKDADIYDKADIATKDCIDLAGKIGNNLGDREIVHCSEDPNYFKTKFSSNTSGSTISNESLASSSADSNGTPGRKVISNAVSSSVNNPVDVQDNLVNKLVNTGRFTVDEAKEFLSKAKQDGTQISTTNDSSKTASRTDNGIKEASSPTKIEGNNIDDKKDSSIGPQNAEDYNDLGQLVRDIKNGNLDEDKIPLKDFQSSGAYKAENEQTQACIDLAGKVGNSLGDREIVHCSEDPNYFKNKYSSASNNDSAPSSSTTSSRPEIAAGNPSKETAADTRSSVAQPSSQTGSISDNTRKNILIDQLVKTGKFTENEATEFAIVDELVNKQKFTEKQAVDFAKKIMQSKEKIRSDEADGPSTITKETDTADKDTTKSTAAKNADKNSLADKSDGNDNVADAKSGNADSKVDESDNTKTDDFNDSKPDKSADVKAENEDNSKVGDSNNGKANKADVKAANSDNAKATNPEDYSNLGKLSHDIKNGDIDADKISLKAFQNSGAYKAADEQTQACIDRAGKIGKNLDDSEIVHCSEDPNNFKN